MESQGELKLRIGTFNLRNTTDHYEKRLPLINETLKRMNFHVAGFQEVSFLEKNQMSDLNSEGKFKAYLASTQLNYGKTNDIEDEKFNIDGNAFLVDSELIKGEVLHNVLHLSPIRCAHMLTFFIEGLRVNVVNLHLHHLEEEEVIRVYQMKSLLKWIDFNSTKEDVTFLLGDFNTLPFSETYNFIKNNGYISSHFSLYNSEPMKTFHNRMEAPFKDASEEGTFDYIFVKNIGKNCKIEKVNLFGTEESEVDKGIYASDHFAMVLEISLN